MFPHQHRHFPSLQVLSHHSPNLKGRSGRDTDLIHQEPEDATETASRLLVRAVPLLYGASLGGLTNHLWLGLSVGITVTAILDIRLEKKSLIRAWLQSPLSRAQPILSMTVTKFFAGFSGLGRRFPRAVLPDSQDLFSKYKST